MSKNSGQEPIPHWHQLIDNLEASPTAFYDSVETAIEERKIPDTKTSRVEWKEGGIASAKRLYLRVTRGQLTIDVCGAPFGRGFFFSSRLTNAVPALPLFAVILMIGVLVAAMKAVTGDFEGGMWFLAMFVAVVIVGWLFARGLVGLVFGGSEERVLAMPVLGYMYEILFRPHSYYKVDAALMFQAAVHAAVLEAIDLLTEAKGIRKLSELERKPVFRDLNRR